MSSFSKEGANYYCPLQPKLCSLKYERQRQEKKEKAVSTCVERGDSNKGESGGTRCPRVNVHKQFTEWQPAAPKGHCNS